MTKTEHIVKCACRGMRHLVMAVAVIGSISQFAKGDEPLEKLMAPLYSFDQDSPHLGTGDYTAGDVLSFDLTAPEAATVHVGAAQLGLVDLADDVDALSGANSTVSAGDSFSLLLSITRGSVGGRPPAGAAISSNVPFNPQDQAAKHQAASDQFMSFILCTLQSGCEHPMAAGGLRAPVDNMALVRNNYNEGGTGFGACPEDPASGGSGSCAAVRGRGAMQDNVDAMAGTGVDISAAGTALYFSLSPSSPSLPVISNSVPPSGANVFYSIPGTPDGTTVFASFADLGLSQTDDIDAMIVFDTNANGQFDGADSVLFSLTPTSPSLASFPDATQFGAAADVFQAHPGGLGVVLFASVEEFGLSARAGAEDDVDAMDFFFCNDAFDCAGQHGIRGKGIPTLPETGLFVLTLLLLAAGGIVFRRRTVA